ncbi:hypothetical protein PRIC1_006133 [Phytophthora ramorum]
MSSQPSGVKARAREEAATKRRRPQSRRETQPKQKKRLVIDLTEEEQTDTENSSKNKAMENPGHLESDDYFEVLRLPRSASESDVKRAYRKLAMQWHPDKNRSNPRAEEFFKKISEAYEVLGDPEKRKVYESYGRAGLEGGAAPSRAAHEQFGFSGRGFSTQHARDIFDAFFGGSDPFEAFFGGGRQRRGSSQRRGRFGEDPFESMGFGGLGMSGFGNMGGIDAFFSDGFGGSRGTVFSTSTSSSSSTFTDRNGHVVMQKTTTTTGMDGRTETVSEEYRNGKLVSSTSSSTAGSRLAGAGRMHLEGTSSEPSLRHIRQSYPRRGSNNSRPTY